MTSNSPSFAAVYLSEPGHKPSESLRGLLNFVRVAERSFATDLAEFFYLESISQSVRLAQIPGFELLTHNPHERVGPARFLTDSRELLFEMFAIGAVVVSQDDEAYARLPPRPQLARNAFLKISLSFMNKAQKGQVGIQSGKQTIEQVSHGCLFQQEDDSVH